MSERVSIKEAAERLGVSQDTVRRRLKSGELSGEREKTPQGFVWRVELPAEPASGDASSGTVQAPTAAAAPAEDVLELARLRERVAGLERERGELIAQRDAWQEQARRSSEAEAQLRELVARAQALAQALPASVGGDAYAEPPESPRTHERAASDAQAARPWWRRVVTRWGA